MTNAELQQLVEKLSLADFGRPFQHQATFNRRLRTTGGRYVLQTHNLEINPLMIEEFNEDTLIGVIKHELVHYHNHIQGLPYQHKDRYFQSELQRIAGLKYAPATSKANAFEFFKSFCVSAAVEGKVKSGEAVATIMRSISLISFPAFLSAHSAALAQR